MRALGKPLRYEAPPALLSDVCANAVRPGNFVEPQAMLLDDGDVINRSSDTEAHWGEQKEVLRREKDFGSPRTSSAVMDQPQASTKQPRTVEGVAKLIALAALPSPTIKPPRLISGADLLEVTERPGAVNRHAPPKYSIYEDIKGAEAKIQDAFELVMNKRRRFMDSYARHYGYQLDPALRSRGVPAPQGAYFAVAHQYMVNTLLEAWWERLGVTGDGWTKYNKKTSTRAILKIREILANGDVEMEISAVVLSDEKRKWVDRVRRVKWWFTSIDLAIDVLSAYGIGKNKFGSGEVRVEVLQYTNPQRKCPNSNHDQGLDAHEGMSKSLPNVFPPVRPCGCYEFKLLMKVIGSARQMQEPNSEKIIKYNDDLMVKGWIETNRRAGIRLQGKWPTDTDSAKNKPVVVPLRGSNFRMWFYLGKERDRKTGDSLRAIRMEGPFAELL